MTCQLEIISLGTIPAAICKCGIWAYTFTELPDDTAKSKQTKLEQAHAEHVRNHQQEKHHEHTKINTP